MSNRVYRSETSQVRKLLVDKWLFPDRQNGIDVGYGGDPLSIHSIAMDLPQPYAHTVDEFDKSYAQHLRGDGRRLDWFKDGVLDYVYSSHMLEDFENTAEILAEWIRVLKPGGRLALCLPDQQKYERYCAETGHPKNGAHKVPHMSREFINMLLRERFNMQILHSEDTPPYSFIVVAQKVSV